MANSNVLLSNYTTLETPAIPVWDTPIPGQNNEQSTLPQYYEASQNVSSNSNQAITYSISPPVPGITIDPGYGTITCAAGTALGDHSVTVIAANNTGPASTEFTWTVYEQPTIPSWDTPIPDQNDPDDTLPQDYDASQHVSSNAGQAIAYSISPPVVDITIHPTSGLITCEAGTSWADHSVTVIATNNTGPASTEFTWTVTEAATAPVQIQAYPDRPIYIDTPISGLDLGDPYWTANLGKAITYTADVMPNGLTIGSDGIVQGTPADLGDTVTLPSATTGAGTTPANAPFTWNVIAIPDVSGNTANKISISIDIGV